MNVKDLSASGEKIDSGNTVPKLAPQKLSVVEKIGYSLGDFAANLVFQTLVTYLAYFYTDIFGLKPEHASIMILIVGLIAAFGFNPLVGALADFTDVAVGLEV